MGDAGTTWGGEFLVCDAASSRRIACLRPMRLPPEQPDRRDPVLAAVAYAQDAGCLDAAIRVLGRNGDVPRIRAELASDDLPVTTAAERLFDAVAALTGVGRRPAPPGASALLLEEAADPSATHEYPFDLGPDQDGMLCLDPRPIVRAVVKDLVQHRTPGQVAGRFHRTVAAAVVAMCRVIGMQTQLRRVCLAGDLFANDLLVSDAAARLSTLGFEMFVPRRIPVGDAGLALGQVLVANARLAGGQGA
jgi:hydrogenase maturation protein HypF